MEARVAQCEQKMAELTTQVQQLANQHTQEFVNTVVKRSLLTVLGDLNKTKLFSSNNSLKSGKTRLKWTFSDYKEAVRLETEEGVFWHESPVFTTHEGGYCMQLMMKFHVEGQDGVYVAAAMQILRGEHDAELTWPALGISLTLVIDGQQGRKCCKLTETRGEQSYEFAAIRRPRGVKNPPFWREGKVMLQKNLEEKYVQNNMLQVRVEVDVDSLSKTCGAIDTIGSIFDGKLEVFQESPSSLLLRSTLLPDTTFQPVCFRYACRLNPTANYFEVEILSISPTNGSIGVGLGGRKFDGQPQMPGWQPNSYGYHSDDGQLFEGMGRGRPFGPICCPGDIIGCGIHYPTPLVSGDQETTDEDPSQVQLFFTHNGMRIGAPLDVTLDSAHVYPLVGIIHKPSAARFFLPYLRPMNDFHRTF